MQAPYHPDTRAKGWRRTDKPLPPDPVEPAVIEPAVEPEEVPWPERDYDAIVAQAVRSAPRWVFDMGARA